MVKRSSFNDYDLLSDVLQTVRSTNHMPEKGRHQPDEHLVTSRYWLLVDPKSNGACQTYHAPHLGPEHVSDLIMNAQITALNSDKRQVL